MAFKYKRETDRAISDFDKAIELTPKCAICYYRAYPVDAHSSTKELQASEWFWTKPQTVFFHPLGGSEPLKN